MKRLPIILFLLAVLLPLGVMGQADTLTLAQLRSAVQADPGRAGGNHYNYQFAPYSAAPAPRGYEAVYISHYGRHGSRHVTNSKKYDDLARIFKEAASAGVLTPEGERLCADYMAIYPKLQYHNGDLTLKGQWQHRELARRMVKAYPSVFRKKVAVDARSTVSHRAMISMMSFCDELRQLRPKATISYAANYSDLHITALNPPGAGEEAAGKDFARMFSSETMRAEFARAATADSHSTEATLGRFFTSLEPLEGCGTPAQMLSDLLEVAGILQCMDFDADLSGYFTSDELFDGWAYSNLFAALMFRENAYSAGFLTARAYTLLDDIISLADSDMASGDIDVRLRFGHDTVVAPLMGLLGVPGWEALGADMTSWKYHFQSWNVPMASNAQFIFYRNRKDPSDILVRLMYNEKDQALPLADQSLAPYYRWSDFKSYYAPVIENARELCERLRSQE